MRRMYVYGHDYYIRATPTKALCQPSSHFEGPKRKKTLSNPSPISPPPDEDASFLSPHPPHPRESYPKPQPAEGSNGHLPAPPRSSLWRYVPILLFSFWCRPWPSLLPCGGRPLLLPFVLLELVTCAICRSGLLLRS